MSNLIIAIISVVLIVVLSIVGVYYGGSIWSDQGTNVDAATTANHAQQVEGAIQLFHSARGSYPASMGDLVGTEYLKTPVPGNWQFEDNYLVTAVANADSCTAMNKIRGIVGVPTCGDVAYEGRTYCCTE